VSLAGDGDEDGNYSDDRSSVDGEGEEDEDEDMLDEEAERNRAVSGVSAGDAVAGDGKRGRAADEREYSEYAAATLRRATLNQQQQQQQQMLDAQRRQSGHPAAAAAAASNGAVTENGEAALRPPPPLGGSLRPSMAGRIMSVDAGLTLLREVSAAGSSTADGASPIVSSLNDSIQRRQSTRQGLGSAHPDGLKPSVSQRSDDTEFELPSATRPLTMPTPVAGERVGFRASSTGMGAKRASARGSASTAGAHSRRSVDAALTASVTAGASTGMPSRGGAGSASTSAFPQSEDHHAHHHHHPLHEGGSGDNTDEDEEGEGAEGAGGSGSAEGDVDYDGDLEGDGDGDGEADAEVEDYRRLLEDDDADFTGGASSTGSAGASGRSIAGQEAGADMAALRLFLDDQDAIEGALRMFG
jgi:hypothetical protein